MVSTSNRTSGKRICAFPGCRRAAVDAVTGGRPSSYCSLPEHNRAAAFRARQAESAALERAAEVEQHVLSMADARLRVVVAELPVLLASHRDAVSDQVAAALEALDVLGDPGAAAAEVAAVRAEAAMLVSRAETDMQAAAAEAAEAREREQAAQAREAAAVAGREAAAEAAAAAGQREQAALAAAEALRDEVAVWQQRAELAEQRTVEAERQAVSAQARAEAAEAAAELAEQRAQAAVARAEGFFNDQVGRLLERLEQAERPRSPGGRS